MSALNWPEAYIIGAPKCGTTAMAQYLSEHPDICVSSPKEPHYLAPDLPGLTLPKTDDEYLSMFMNTEAKTRVDASIWYLYSKDAVKNILAKRPDAKFIIHLRNPMRMLPSLHRQLFNVLDEDVPDFSEAWRLSEARSRGENLPPNCRAPETLVYTQTAAFGAQLERLFTLVDKSAVLVIFQEEMKRDTGAAYRRVLEFLQIPDNGRKNFGLINDAKGFRNRSIQFLIKRDIPMVQAVTTPLKSALGLRSLGLRRALDGLNRRPPETDDISSDVKNEMIATYRNDMDRLSNLLKRDLQTEFGWLQ